MLERNYILLHGFSGGPDQVFFPWLKGELEAKGYSVTAPQMPNSDNPTEEEQVGYCLNNLKFDENTVIVAHSLGCAVALKVLEKLPSNISGLVLIGGFISPKFKDHPRAFENKFNWNFDFEKIRSNAGVIKLLHDPGDYAVSDEQAKYLSEVLKVDLTICSPSEPHFTGPVEKEVLENVLI